MKYVYVLRTGENNYKVGIALSVTKRLQSLRTSNPQKIVIIAVRLISNPTEVEHKLHVYLAKHRAIDGGTEWFVLTPKQVLRLLILLNEEPEISGLAEHLNVKQMLLKHESEFDFMFENLTHIREYLQHEFDENLAMQLEKERLEKIRIKTLAPPRSSIIDDSEMIEKAIEVVRKEGRASTSLLQRRMRIGYSRAARLIEMMEDQKIITPQDGIRARSVYPA